MPLVKVACEIGLNRCVTLFASPLPLAALVPHLAIIMTPAVTFIIGDIVASMADDVTQELLWSVSELVLD